MDWYRRSSITRQKLEHVPAFCELKFVRAFCHSASFMLSSSLRRAGTKSTEKSVSNVRHASSSSDFVKLLERKAKKPEGTDLKRIKSTASQLISGAKQSQNPEWHHTYQKKQESRRLEMDILKKKDPAMLDGRGRSGFFAGHSLENWTMEDVVQSGTMKLQPGTYYELRRFVCIL